MMPARRSVPDAALSRLLDGIGRVPPVLDATVAGVCEDSREVGQGSLFIARRGRAHDATRFAPEVAAAGACAMVFEGAGQAFVDDAGLLWIPVPDLADAAGVIADRFFGTPSLQLTVVAVTGTNAKSSVAHHVASAAALLEDRPAGTIGTLGAGLLPSLDEAALTTPDCVSVHRALARFVEAGARFATLEASSHALDQGRLAAVRVDTAVFTNLSRDHLDYHGDMGAYLDAKLTLVEEFSPRALVLNADDPASRKFRAAAGPLAHRLEFSLAGASRAGLTGSVLEATRDGITLRVDFDGRSAVLRSPLLGTLAAQNLLAALGVLLVNGFELEPAVDALSRVPPVRGRLEAIAAPGGPLAVVDYAHTPAALETALKTLRPLGTARLWCVFGAGGDRDAGKRPLMGRAAARHADRVVITDDNPRSEDGARIAADVLAGVPERARKRVAVIRDRRTAIEHALSHSEVDDIVLIAGKGHETYQLVGGRTLAFDDADVVREWIAERATC